MPCQGPPWVFIFREKAALSTNQFPRKYLNNSLKKKL